MTVYPYSNVIGWSDDICFMTALLKLGVFVIEIMSMFKADDKCF